MGCQSLRRERASLSPQSTSCRFPSNSISHWSNSRCRFLKLHTTTRLSVTTDLGLFVSASVSFVRRVQPVRFRDGQFAQSGTRPKSVGLPRVWQAVCGPSNLAILMSKSSARHLQTFLFQAGIGQSKLKRVLFWPRQAPSFVCDSPFLRTVISFTPGSGVAFGRFARYSLMRLHKRTARAIARSRTSDKSKLTSFGTRSLPGRRLHL